uniref:GMC oxidoreductase n=1 Tax=Nocardia amikacinitolerans TaxID=756689 RepID=UPI0012EEA34D
MVRERCFRVRARAFGESPRRRGHAETSAATALYRIGTDPANVVTLRLEVLGVPGLRVADASVMPLGAASSDRPPDARRSAPRRRASSVPSPSAPSPARPTCQPLHPVAAPPAPSIVSTTGAP